MSNRRTTLFLASLPLLLAVAACSGSGGSGGYGAPAGAAASATPSSTAGGGRYGYGDGTGASASAEAGGDIVVATGSGAAGAFLTGPNGMTLYVFTKDSEDKSACIGDCAANWPPLLADEGATVSAGDGVPGALSTFYRDDGSEQVSYNGKPLYYFASDKAPGDTNGQGANDVWFIAQP